MSIMSLPSSQSMAAKSAVLDEADRVAALQRYQVLDTPQELAFDRIVQLAARLLDAPIAMISLVDVQRQWFKARYGIEVQETPRAIAFCDHTIRSKQILVVPDAEKDPRFRDNPAVTGDMHVRFYAGAPLLTPDGFALGAICAIDRTPRKLEPRDATILAALAEQVVHELEVRAALGELYREVAEGRRVTRTLRGQEAKLEALLNVTENAVIDLDTDGQVASLNRAAEAMFGFDPGESVGRPLERLVSTGTGIADHATAAQSSIGKGWRKDGSEFPVEVSSARWTDAQGFLASVTIVRDITERRRAETETRRREAAAQTQDKLAALGRTAGGVAHELNNLLQPIIGLTQLELDLLPSEGTAEQQDTRDSLTMILESGNQARNVVRKLQMFARKVKPVLAPVDMRVALHRVAASCRKQLSSAIHLDLSIDDGAVGMANINEAELAEVMTNLLANAAYAMNGRGVVSINLDRLAPAGAAAAPGLAAGPCFRIVVADTGSGMDDTTKAQIFEPFFTTKPIGQGTGLGLSIVYGVLHDWKGAVTVDSAVGSGSRFSLYITVAA
jgi:PAS domain S-box-containing protein